ncbi:fasciclin domain-containing protein [Pontibacter qinzhouensis]|uniref:fasciclin domain-containing protein n=1 Tax=Pontibacter qinzhouensis TaxID=2603253 RepID=UPI00165079FA|nr:fasciclin domain-containing protein [Pontibacter qinzhouensis]
MLILLTNCKDKDEHYVRPDSLEDPIYQQLEARGNFKNLLALIEKADYKITLQSGAGYWTLFAPNDAAFEKYFAGKGISGVDAIDKATATQIVKYVLVYNAFMTDRLDDYQSPTGWADGQAFKRKTAYYKGVNLGTVKQGDNVLTDQFLISANRNGNFVFTDNNNKYIPYYINTYFAGQQLSGADYNFFYPDVAWNNSFHVANAKVVTSNIIAENGIIHEIDEVILPLHNIDEHLAGKPEYSVFRDLFEKYMVYYMPNAQATQRNQLLTGSGNPVYVKMYDNQLEFSLNDEGFEVSGATRLENEGQSNTYTIFAPKNEVVTNYFNTVLTHPEKYKSVEELPVNVIRDFLNAHMFPMTVWPSKFNNLPLKTSPDARLDAGTHVTEAKVLSNGFFYGTNKVQEANVFHTVYGKAYLNPSYSMMIRALEAYKESLIIPNVRYTLFLISDKALTEAGFSWNTRFSRWDYASPTGGVNLAGASAQLRLQRIIEQHIVPAGDNRNQVFSNLNGEGVMRTFGEEFIRYTDGKVFAGGNADQNELVNLIGPEQTSNGVVYYVDRILNFSDLKASQHIAANPAFSHFYNYIANSTLLWDPATLHIKGTAVGTPYTYLIPTNEAIQQAVDDGLLPGTAAGPNFTPGTTADQDKVVRFIQYHIIAKDQVALKNLPDDARHYETVFRNVNGVIGAVQVAYNGSQMVITDAYDRTAKVISPNSNILSNRAVIHQIDNYLQYREF